MGATIHIYKCPLCEKEIIYTSKESHPSQYHKCDLKKYDRNELIKLMRMRALGESDFYDDVYTSDRAQFIDSVSKFIQWIDKMQTKNKI